MKEKLIIENFGGIEHAEFEFSSINIIIGPQASGKSVTVKLMYFFKNFFEEVYRSVQKNENFNDFSDRLTSIFDNYFPPELQHRSPWRITYQYGSFQIRLDRIGLEPLNFHISPNAEKLYNQGLEIFQGKQLGLLSSREIMQRGQESRELFRNLISDEIGIHAAFNQLFLPAGRSFFSNIQSSIFSFLSTFKALDPFLVEFGALYEKVKGFADFFPTQSSLEEFELLAAKILKGKYRREDEKDYIIHKDGRKVNLAYSSSGQQETTPLILIFRSLILWSSTKSGYQELIEKGASLFVEEPEAHLFPVAQKRMVELMSMTFNSKSDSFQYFITTHSPYILSSFNTLVEAGKIKLENPHLEPELEKIVPKNVILPPDAISAFSLQDGLATSLIDSETGLIGQNFLDQVSEEIAIEFGNLLDLAY